MYSTTNNHFINERSVKTVKHILTVLIALIFLALQACEGPAGPAGAQGPSGSNGANGVDAGFVYFEGFKDSLKCASCHTPDTDTVYYKAAASFQWAKSKHAIGGTAFENRTTCAECHTTEGYVQKQTGLAVTQAFNSTPVGCFACHSPHKNGDFSLRTVAPVTLLSNITGVADASFDYGNGNLCVSCHRPRSTSVKLDVAKLADTDSLVIPSRWYGHYGVQGQMLMGEGGFEYTGYTYPNSFHTTATAIKEDGCSSCHMANAVGDFTGGHTMMLDSEEEGENVSGCNVSGCHSGLTTLDYNGKMTEVHANMDTLKSLLVVRGWIDTVANTPKTGKVIKPARLGGAVWNYFLVEHDLSAGVHNTKYALALLRASITELRK